jgi:hypothetical protein
VVAGGERVVRSQQEQRDRNRRRTEGREGERHQQGGASRGEEAEAALDGVEGRRDAERRRQR